MSYPLPVALLKYKKQNTIPLEESQLSGMTIVLYNTYYVDEFYTAIIVKPLNGLSKFFRDYIETGISFLILGLGKITNELSFYGRKLHNGSIGFYLFVFVIGLCAMIFYLFLAQ